MTHGAPQPETAKIYAFPKRPLAARKAARTDVVGGDLRSLQIARGAFDGAWYHDLAIQEARPKGGR